MKNNWNYMVHPQEPLINSILRKGLPVHVVADILGVTRDQVREIRKHNGVKTEENGDLPKFIGTYRLTKRATEDLGRWQDFLSAVTRNDTQYLAWAEYKMGSPKYKMWRREAGLAVAFLTKLAWWAESGETTD